MAFGVVRKKRRLVNPGRRRKKKMTAKQIRFFGTKAQRAGLRRRKRRPNAGKRRRRSIFKDYKLVGSQYVRRNGSKKRKRAKRKKNVGSILVASIPGLNPGRKRRKTNSMARSRRRRRNRARVVHHRRRRRYTARRRTRRSNPRVVVRYSRRRRRHNVRHRRGRRRNPGMLGGMGGDATAVAGVLGGVAVTRLLAGFIPAGYNTGIPGYIITAIAAVAQGQAVSKLLRKPVLGKFMTIGGFAYLTARILNDFVPTIGGYLGMSGLGLLAPTQGFMLPNVNQFGSMGRFQVPNSILSKIQAAQMTKGVHGLPRIGRIQ